MSSEDIKRAEDVARAWIKGIETKDKPALMALFTEDAIIELPFSESGKTGEGFFRRYQGTEQLNNFHDVAFAAEDHVYMQKVEIVVSHDLKTLFVEAHGDGLMTSGKIYCNRYVFRFDLRDGKIWRLREFYNPIITACAFGRLIAGKIAVESI